MTVRKKRNIDARKGKRKAEQASFRRRGENPADPQGPAVLAHKNGVGPHNAVATKGGKGGGLSLLTGTSGAAKQRESRRKE